MDAFTPGDDVVTPMISVLHSFGLMDFRCGGVDSSALCDKLSCLRCSCCGATPAVSRSAGPAHDRPLQRLDLGRPPTGLITIFVQPDP